MPTLEKAAAKAKPKPSATPAQRSSATPSGSLVEAPPLVQQVLRSPGQPAAGDTRALLESRFGHDFGRVRIHSDSLAAESARQVQARAYTVGNDVVFGAGQYRPGTRSGLELMAHEFAHVVQQGGRPQALQARLTVGSPGTASEREADAAAAAVLQGRRVTPLSRTTAHLARWKIDGSTATVTSEEDRLGQLPAKVSSNALNWVGIKPLAMKTAGYATPPEDFQTHYEKYLQIGDTFDLSNLTATTGTSLRINFHSHPDIQTLISLPKFYPGTKQIKSDPMTEIEKASGEGATPLIEAIFFGHSGGDRMTGGASNSACYIAPQGLKPDEPAPTYDRARAGKFPRRCWFTKNAKVRAAGCTSSNFGTVFSSVFLRKGSEVFTTLRSISPSCSLKYRPPGGDVTTCKDNLDAMEFRTNGTESSDPTEHGPFVTAADFEASSFWAGISGTL